MRQISSHRKFENLNRPLTLQSPISSKSYLVRAHWFKSQNRIKKKELKNYQDN